MRLAFFGFSFASSSFLAQDPTILLLLHTDQSPTRQHHSCATFYEFEDPALENAHRPKLIILIYFWSKCATLLMTCYGKVHFYRSSSFLQVHTVLVILSFPPLSWPSRTSFFLVPLLQPNTTHRFLPLVKPCYIETMHLHGLFFQWLFAQWPGGSIHPEISNGVMGERGIPATSDSLVAQQRLPFTQKKRQLSDRLQKYTLRTGFALWRSKINDHRGNWGSFTQYFQSLLSWESQAHSWNSSLFEPAVHYWSLVLHS